MLTISSTFLYTSKLFAKTLLLLKATFFVWPGLKVPNLTYGSQIWCDWIQNIARIPLVFVAKLYCN